jgi:hypothetical protein
MNKEEWLEYNRKVAEIRQVANIALDKAEQQFKQRITEERKAFIDEATRIAIDIIEKEQRKNPQPEKYTGNGADDEDDEEDDEILFTPSKQKIVLNEENIKILHQLAQIQARKKMESQRNTGKPLHSPREEEFEEEQKAEHTMLEQSPNETEEEFEGLKTTNKTEDEEEQEAEGYGEDDLEPDEEFDEPQPDDPNTIDERVRKAMERPKIYPPLGQKRKKQTEMEMPSL